MIKISSKFGIKQYVHEDNIIHFQRIYGGVCGKSAVVLGEDHFLDQTNFFLLAEIHATTIHNLLSEIQEMIIRYHKKIKVSEWFYREDLVTKKLLTRHQYQAFKDRKPMVKLFSAPDTDDTIVYQVETIMSQLQPVKRLFMFNESRVPSALSALPQDYRKIKSEDYPVVSALGCALTALIDYPYSGGSTAYVPVSIYSLR